jgi:hypothetical protein
MESGMPHSSRFSVRKAVIADAVQILDCLSEAFAPFRDAYTPEAFLDTVLTPATLEQRLKTMTVFVALDVAVAGDVVGTVGCELAASRRRPPSRHGSTFKLARLGSCGGIAATR